MSLTFDDLYGSDNRPVVTKTLVWEGDQVATNGATITGIKNLSDYDDIRVELSTAIGSGAGGIYAQTVDAKSLLAGKAIDLIKISNLGSFAWVQLHTIDNAAHTAKIGAQGESTWLGAIKLKRIYGIKYGTGSGGEGTPSQYPTPWVNIGSDGHATFAGQGKANPGEILCRWEDKETYRIKGILRMKGAHASGGRVFNLPVGYQSITPDQVHQYLATGVNSSNTAAGYMICPHDVRTVINYNAVLPENGWVVFDISVAVKPI